MAHVTVKWLEKKRFVATDSTDHSVVLSGTNPEEGGIGMKPSEMLLVALGGCTLYDVVGILEKKRQPVLHAEARVTAEQQPDPPWTFTKFHVHFVITGDVSEKAVQDAVELSDTKYCSVSNTLRLAVPVTHSYEIDTEGKK